MRRKRFLPVAELDSITPEMLSEQSSCTDGPLISFPSNATDSRSFDSRKYLGKNYDAIVLMTFATVSRLLKCAIDTAQQTHAYTTIVSYCTMGLTYLYEYCEHLINTKTYDVINNSDITEEFILEFVNFLMLKQIKSQRHILTRVKSVLIERECAANPNWFPTNSFPKRDPDLPPRSTPFSKQERKSLTAAVTSEVKSILMDKKPLAISELAYCLVLVANKTGANLQPLLELDITAIIEHPLHPHKKLLILYKRKGNTTHPIPLAPEHPETDYVELTASIEKTIRSIILRNANARESSTFPDRVFVAKSITNPEAAGIALTGKRVRDAIKTLAKNHSLKGDDGKQLVVNLERIRKTWINNLFEVSGQDPFITAALANHGVKVSNDYYLQAPPDAQKNHAFMGEVRVQELLQPASSTIIASCRDNLQGERAPKNGSICMQVLGCFDCSEFIVTGDDLYRLCSFYFHCFRNRSRLGVKQWRQTYSAIVRTIQNTILPNFDKKLVAVAMDKARTQPHPAWAH
ncbi:hypothetical protein [Pseudomonas syringae]|uniref:hypothetical protein n=1 Tax=Pseudomonas syringae TaxID=317 RepID=UPI000B3098EC|nr:hypothetical protein [Pseudomonas syringae]